MRLDSKWTTALNKSFTYLLTNLLQNIGYRHKLYNH